MLHNKYIINAYRAGVPSFEERVENIPFLTNSFCQTEQGCKIVKGKIEKTAETMNDRKIRGTVASAEPRNKPPTWQVSLLASKRLNSKKRVTSVV
ncbi:hypothetical protein AKJ51_01705 [candidate division MSBL1 archaeon SCGC-AAA382A20]|uniref:Uncharacterized protein n=1 Tax=candidate division MSBL1 archaeon SCGC-AAA382A20 TaxID=1698280 RepID=A0A133VLA3_9EURY|nr:hypothetical protein AKJ51_01705 [candidate division MSBL1 archaeon SCGC-AAA382A20]